MEQPPPLPLPPSQLPESIRRFGDPAGPLPARTMAAKGLVPVKGTDLVTLLIQLTRDAEPSVAAAAEQTMVGLPEGILLAACAAPLHPSVLDALADRCGRSGAALEAVVSNSVTADSTIRRVARMCAESITEMISSNEQRLIGAPAIIEALYMNSNTRMSTADRLIELAARHELRLDAIPAYEAHVRAIQGQLIPEPSDEPMPGDIGFREALAHDEDDPDAIERDAVDGTETLKRKFTQLRQQIGGMTDSEKIRMAMVGSAAARAILIRDPRREIADAAARGIKSDREAANIAMSREVGEDILRLIGSRKRWLSNYEVKKALVLNPKTPVAIALQFLTHLRDSDLRALSRSRNVAGPIKSAASMRYQQKTRSSGKGGGRG